MASMKFVLYLKIRNLLVKWFLGRKNYFYWSEWTNFRVLICNSDDEGSDEEEEEGEEGDENYEDEEEDYEEEEGDEDYEDEEGDEEDVESPSFFFGQNSNQQPARNNFQFGSNKTTPAQPESVSDLSSMIANFNVCSPFSFGTQSKIEVISIFIALSSIHLLFVDERK